MIIIDFDDTLFNTQAIKKELERAALEKGIPKEMFWQAYKKAYEKAGTYCGYTIERHVNHIDCQEKEEIAAALHKTVQEPPGKYAYEETVEFLKKIEKTQHRKVLLSLGNDTFQKEKVNTLSIKKYFDTIVFTEAQKTEVIGDVLKKISKGEAVWLINDKIEETKNIVKLFPEIKPILKVSPRYSIEEYTKSNYPYFENLLECIPYVTRN